MRSRAGGVRAGGYVCGRKCVCVCVCARARAHAWILKNPERKKAKYQKERYIEYKGIKDVEPRFSIRQNRGRSS